jgi:hypothetical protein
MQVTNRVYVYSGASDAGFKAYKRGVSWDQAERSWIKARRNSTWVTQALRGFREAGGSVPKERFPENNRKQ